MKYIIFGTGTGAEKVFDKVEYDIDYFLDNNKSKQGSMYKGRPVYAPDVLKNEDKDNIFIIVASTYYDEIRIQLENMGFLRQKHFINGLQRYEIFTTKISGYIEIGDPDLKVLKSVDMAGRILIDEKNTKIYRGIFKEYANDYRKIFELVQSVPGIQTDIISTRLSDKSIYPFELILEHEYIDRINYSFEWSPLMFQDAAIFVLELMEKLHKVGLGLKDAHSGNVTFFKGKWIMLDYTSLILGKTSNDVLKEFVTYFIRPLILMSKKQYRKVLLYFIPSSGIKLEDNDIYGYLDSSEKSAYDSLKGELESNTIDLCSKLYSLKSFISMLKIEQEKTLWSNYQDESFHYINDREKWNMKARNTVELVEEIMPDSVLDIAGNEGWYCHILEEKGIKCTFFDYDYNSIDNGYKRIKNRKSNILPLVKDFRKVSLEDVKRFKSDLVIALALVHHLIFSQSMTFEEIFKTLDNLAKDYLIIEFISSEDEFVAEWMSPSFNWYTWENFVFNLNQYFDIVKIKDSSNSHRKIVLCKKHSSINS